MSKLWEHVMPPEKVHLEIILSWLVIVSICSTIRESSTVHCLSRQWLAITLMNCVTDSQFEMTSLAAVTNASLFCKERNKHRSPQENTFVVY